MDANELRFSFAFLQWLVTAAVGIYAWHIGRQSARVKETNELRERLIALEGQMKEVPSQVAMGQVAARLERLDAELGSNNRELKAINASLNRINDYLLNSK